MVNKIENDTKQHCELLGGAWDDNDKACSIVEILTDPDIYKTVDDPKYALYYFLQVFIGTALTFFGTFSSVTIVSPWWYFNLILLIVACGFFLFIDWYRGGYIVETIKHLLILLPIYIVVAIVLQTTAEFGTPINTTYWVTGTFLTTTPVIAVISAMFVASLLSVFLLPKQEIIQLLSKK